MRTLYQMAYEVRAVNIEKGWRSVGDAVIPWGDYVALLNTEVAEILEAYRRWGLRDATTAYAPGLTGRMPPPKPEGVGSECADVLIRWLDMADAYGMMSDVAHPDDTLDAYPRNPPVPRPPSTVGGWNAWQVTTVAALYPDTHDRPSPHAQLLMPFVLGTLLSFCDQHSINLYAEYERKIAYNRTRPYRHGGKLA